MPYNRLLMKIVAESGLTSKAIVEECNKRGKKIDKTYFSKLLNNKVSPPAEDISRLISNICNVDERLLVIEGYLDKAPKEIKELFVSLKKMTAFSALTVFQNEFNKDILQEVEEQLEKEPLSDFIISLMDNGVNDMELLNNGIEFNDINDNMKLTLTEPVAFTANDNAMFPMIPEGAKVSLTLQNEYANGDILVCKIKKEEDILIRYCLFNDNNIILTPLNKSFKTLTYPLEDIIILGKVTKTIIDI